MNENNFNGVKKNFDKEEVKDAAKGREIEILRNVAGIPDELLDGKHHPCPKCGGTDRFRLLDPKAGAVFCNGCFNKNNGDFIAAVKHYRDVDFPEALTLIGDYLFGGAPSTATAISPATSGETTAKQTTISVYTDQEGKPLYRVKRTDWIENGKPEKSFLQKRWSSTLNNWESGTKGIEPVPLHWPSLIARKGEPACIVEGEKCCDALSSLGYLATTSGGSNTKIDWSKFTDVFYSGREVFIFPDEDRAGYEYALKTADSLRKTCTVKIVFLPGLAHKEDIADWIKRGGTREELDRIIAETPIWNGEQLPARDWEIESCVMGKDGGKGTALLNEKDTCVIVPNLINPALVESKPINWLWENKIPSEMITLFAGRQGCGKTFFTCYMAAVITNGWDWPDGTPCEQGSVLFFYGEDLIDKTMVPRLQAQGTDLSKIRILDGFKSIDKDGNEVKEIELTLKRVDEIRAAIQQTELETGLPCRLVVVDPVSNHWGGVKENDNAQVREVLKPIGRLAEETGTAIVLITHFGKTIRENSADKVLGSTALTAVARTVWYFYRDANQPDHRCFVPSKDNVLIEPTGVVFTINREANGRIETISTELKKTADDIEAEHYKESQARKRGSGGRPPEQLEECVAWLADFLKDGPKPSGNEKDAAAGSIRHEANKAGHKWRTVRRAQKELEIVQRKIDGVYKWSLADQDETGELSEPDGGTNNDFLEPLEDDDPPPF